MAAREGYADVRRAGAIEGEVAEMERGRVKVLRESF